ncbi:MAG: ABC transporter ATP-binding protein, partial [Planctomycetota bacterium]|nr:ABC transporter ATP-binding protein [Planctomycetota bacterium]
MLPALTRRALRSDELADREFWALRDLSFSVERGEALGIIGHNGAGKSTLLKLMSGIMEPTRGSLDVSGRLSALIEVGAGFHPDLTGRENVYLNGTILGMRRAEIRRKFDQIVAFSGLEEFIDTPVKRYSSGMRVRLAFAVAAHLEPEILLVDEVLAVGDVAFQNKCLGKMDEASRSSRTILFVSHNMGMMTRLCTRAIWIDGGQIRLSGSPTEVVAEYLSSAEGISAAWTHPSAHCYVPEAQ